LQRWAAFEVFKSKAATLVRQEKGAHFPSAGQAALSLAFAPCSKIYTPFASNAQLRWDDQHLYVGGYMEEPQVWATLSQHDSVIFNDNDFEVRGPL
jgi:hypothetical protein